MRAVICAGHGFAGRGFAFTNPLPAHAPGIAAEIPQDLHGQIRGIAAESPVFCGAKKAPVKKITVS
jgi:hypothetical protein